MASNAPGSQQVVPYANLASHLRSLASPAQTSGRVTLVRSIVVPVAGTAFLGLAASPQTFAIINSGHGRDVLLPVGASVNPLQVLRCRQSYVNGFLIFSRGSPPASGPCTQCRDRGNSLPFSRCHHARGHFGGACASCKWTDHASKCSLYDGNSRGLPAAGSSSAGALGAPSRPPAPSAGSAASSSALVRSRSGSAGARTSTPAAGASLSFAVPIGNPLLGRTSGAPFPAGPSGSTPSAGPSSSLVRTAPPSVVDLTGDDDEEEDEDEWWNPGVWDDLVSAGPPSASSPAAAARLSSASGAGPSRAALPAARTAVKEEEEEEEDEESDTEYPVPPLREVP